MTKRKVTTERNHSDQTCGLRGSQIWNPNADPGVVNMGGGRTSRPTGKTEDYF